VDYQEHIDAIAGEAALLAAALDDGSADAPVPTCPEWSVAQLAEHVNGFTGFWTHVLCEGTGRPKTPFDGLSFSNLATGLLNELRTTAPGTPVWSWVPGQENAAFVARRATHELAVHRYDAQTARSRPQPIPSAVAADGIEEIFVMIGAWGAPAGTGSGETLHLHATDVDGEWLITLAPAGLIVERSHAKADLALRGAASDLELLLYQRPPLGAIESFGDQAVIDAWYRAFKFG
jgi:uncharacterized protein (TIGR03083 family)